jgi:ABC-type polysaccharide/polyol phosphate transport system ATPase subunit
MYQLKGGNEVSIELVDVSKRFHFYEHRTWSLRELFVRTISGRYHPREDSHFSIQNISLSIAQGETWALIGPNGAGKSTLLRLMAGIYWPTSGTVRTQGRLAALVELAAGFHPELTGSENVYLYGALLGLNKEELTKRYCEISAFAGIQEFMDTPVKYYSSGMRIRLGFSVATSLEPDILLLDEILAVGDVAFQEKCMERLRAFQNAGCTLIVATHDLETARTFSAKALWVDQGRICLQGSAEQVVREYELSSLEQ